MKNLTVIFLCLLLASVTLGCGKKNGIRATYAGNINTYCEMKDGTWSCNDRSYEYRLERRGRLPNAECDSVFVYLSNLPDISFEHSGLFCRRGRRFSGAADGISLCSLESKQKKLRKPTG